MTRRTGDAVFGMSTTETKLVPAVRDWDVEPTAFDEYVTIQGTAVATNVLFASNDGFQTSNPLAAPTNLGFTGDFVDAYNTTNAHDHGAMFDFGFGMLAAGGTQTFNIYYGVSSTEAGAISALGAVGAEVYSLGQNSTATGHTVGDPATFIFAFQGVGGEPVPGFDKCLQDARTQNILQWNSTTGAWQYVRNDGCEVLLSGTGTVTMDGPLCQLRDFSNGNFVSAYIDTAANYGKARIRLTPGGRIRDMFDPHTDDECECSSSGQAKGRRWPESTTMTYAEQGCRH